MTATTAKPALFSSSAVLRCLLLLLLTLSCAACSTTKGKGGAQPKPPEPKIVETEDKAVQIWRRFVARTDTAETMSGPFRISANLRYTDDAGESTRVSALLWGNGESASPYPLRLDLVAGVGTVVAKAREDADSFMLYSPDEKTAYSHQGYDKTLSSFGVPIPLSLGNLTLLLTGRGGHLFRPTGAESASGVPQEHELTAKGATYTIPGAPLPGILELSSVGAPLAWRESNPKGWQMEFEPSELNPLQPRKVSMSHSTGYKAIIIVKELERVSPPYSSSRLSLALPPGTPVRPLNQ
ncbi:hypothetical protein LJC59_02215 [Desulfovibrio sp. OttesenSCG-928-A18]|nr:hypothetical protein [Desulfovibrio sp. OttesenSCG-928-A18]